VPPCHKKRRRAVGLSLGREAKACALEKRKAQGLRESRGRFRHVSVTKYMLRLIRCWIADRMDGLMPYLAKAVSFYGTKGIAARNVSQ